MKTTMEAVGATGAALVLEDGNIAWPEGRAGAHAVRLPLRWKRRADRRARLRPRHAVHRRRARAARLDRAPRGGRARARARGHARRARPGDPPPRQEQPPDRRVAAAAAGARRGRRPAEGARGLGQPDPRDRGRARGADRAARRGRRARRAARPAARDARPGPRRGEARRDARSSRSRSPATARPRWRSSSASCSRTRSSTAATRSGSSSLSANGEVVLAIADDGSGIAGERGTARASRSCARSSATSSAGRSTCSRTADSGRGRVPGLSRREALTDSAGQRASARRQPIRHVAGGSPSVTGGRRARRPPGPSARARARAG